MLAIQDTTEFNLSHLPATEGLGRGTGNNEQGFMMHSLLAVTPEGLPLGVLGMKTRVRPQEVFGKRAPAVTRPIEQKESNKWLEGIDHPAALKVRCTQTRFVCVGDRESGLYELFVAERPDGVDWLIRAVFIAAVRPCNPSFPKSAFCRTPTASDITKTAATELNQARLLRAHWPQRGLQSMHQRRSLAMQPYHHRFVQAVEIYLRPDTDRQYLCPDQHADAPREGESKVALPDSQGIDQPSPDSF